LLELFRVWFDSCCKSSHSGYRKLSTSCYYWWRWSGIGCGLFAPRNRLRYMSAIAALRLDLRATDHFATSSKAIEGLGIFT
jgi:hypothetical protein